VIGAIVPLAEYLSRVRLERSLPSLTMRDVIVATIKAYEILGVRLRGRGLEFKGQGIEFRFGI
jgi:2-methylcitrate dehydratase PrpD